MKDSLPNLRHSAAHLLAAAIQELYPDSLRTIGPSIDDGFYFDFDFPSSKPTEEDLPKIEAKMRQILKSWKDFKKVDVTREQAEEEFADNRYKLELIEEFSGQSQDLTIYQSGDYRDLCRGGHVKSPNKELTHFKLLSIAGAYWRGDSKNKMLTRIYGTAFPSQEELDQHLTNLQEAKDRDHRKIGKDLELFTISEKVGQGLILWLPNGNTVKEELENFAKKTEKDWGYQRVTTPNITKSELYYTSGHLPYYKADMYPPMKLDDNEEYFLKPMNCPHHHMIYDARPRSYKELPLRLAEYGTCYRYEASGELFGLMRVRGFTQNDSHIYCTQEQAVEEFVNVMKLHQYFYETFGIKKYHLVLALRDPKNKQKYHGDEAMWQKAEELMRQAVAQVNIPMVEEIGSAAFYGPKIDFVIHSSIGREFAISTNQIDMFMGTRFGLKYADKDGTEKTPVIIHRAPLGSHERFIGFLIEHFGGAFPLWLHPTQVAILPVSDKFLDYAKSVHATLLDAGIRATLDESAQGLGKKIRGAQLQKTPYMLIIGGREVDDKTVSVRTRKEEDLGAMKLTELIKTLNDKIATKALD